MNYSARTSAAGGGEQTRAAAPLAEGLPGTAPASAPRPPEIPRRDQGTCGERISALCWSWDVFICCDVPDSLLWRCQQCRLVLLLLSQSSPNAAGDEGLRQHPRTRPCVSTGHGALRHDGTEMGEMLTMLLATTTPAVGLVRPSAEEEADRLQASRREPGLGLQLKSSHRQRAVTAERSAALTAAGACWNCCTRQ